MPQTGEEITGEEIAPRTNEEIEAQWAALGVPLFWFLTGVQSETPSPRFPTRPRTWAFFRRKEEAVEEVLSCDPDTYLEGKYYRYIVLEGIGAVDDGFRTYHRRAEYWFERGPEGKMVPCNKPEELGHVFCFATG